MTNLLLGSSNVYRHFKRSVEKGLFVSHPLKLLSCTKQTVFDTHLASSSSFDLMVTSVLENFVVDVCDGLPDAEIGLFANQQITAHVDAIFAASIRVSSANFVIVPPFYRSVPGWFGPHLPGMLAHLAAEVSRTGSFRIAILPQFVVLPSMLEPDGVHLTNVAGDQFMAMLDSQLASLFVPPPQPGVSGMSAPANDDRLDQILAAVNLHTSQFESLKNLSQTVTKLQSSTTSFETYVRVRHQNDDFIFARMKEESDTEVNRSREDRVCVTGLPVPPSNLSTHKDKKDHYLGIVNELVTLCCAAVPVTPVVVDVYVNLRKTLGQHLVEVRFSTRTGAQDFRREGVRVAKERHPKFGELFFANSVTHSTRVRIEILRVLSSKLSTASELAFVQGFVSRPVLHYRARPDAVTKSTADGTGRSYTFVDAMGKFGSRLTQQELFPAYARAANVFNGSLSQYFIVLSEKSQPISTRDGSYRSRGRGRGRGRRPGSASGSSRARGSWASVASKSLKRPAAASPSSGTPSKKKEKEDENIVVDESDEVEAIASLEGSETPESSESPDMEQTDE